MTLVRKKSSLRVPHYGFYTRPAQFSPLRSVIYRCHFSQRRETANHESKQCDPLRILFCGSDNFSVASLEKLHNSREKLNIKSIDVVTKPPQRVGRGFKELSIVPVEQFATKASLPLHQIETFTGWLPPTPEGYPINLIIAVSFGLLVPQRILNGAKYGGINLHPSKLPELRGPAPLQHTLIRCLDTTHLTLQTLHPKKFDHGAILAQSGELQIPEKSKTDLQELIQWISPLSASFLHDSMAQKVFVPPILDLSPPVADEKALHPAPKTTKADLHIDWSTMPSREILARVSFTGKVWNDMEYRSCGEVRTCRIQLLGLRKILASEFMQQNQDGGYRPLDTGILKPGSPIEIFFRPSQSTVGLWTVDGELITVENITIPGRAPQKSAIALKDHLKVEKLEDCVLG